MIGILFAVWFSIAIILMGMINQISIIVLSNKSPEEKIKLLQLFCSKNIINTMIKYYKFNKALKTISKIVKKDKQNETLL